MTKGGEMGESFNPDDDSPSLLKQPAGRNSPRSKHPFSVSSLLDSRRLCRGVFPV